MVRKTMKSLLIVKMVVFAFIAAAIQCLPLVLGENFVFLTVFSIIPIYLIAFFTPRHGLFALIIAFIAIAAFSLHEGLIFLLTSGPLGLLGGFFHHKKSRKIFSIIITGAVLFIGIFLLVNQLGVNGLIGNNNNVNQFLISNLLISAGVSIISYFLLLGFNKIMFDEVRK